MSSELVFGGSPPTLSLSNLTAIQTQPLTCGPWLIWTVAIVFICTFQLCPNSVFACLHSRRFPRIRPFEKASVHGCSGLTVHPVHSHTKNLTQGWSSGPGSWRVTSIRMDFHTHQDGYVDSCMLTQSPYGTKWNFIMTGPWTPAPRWLILNSQKPVTK